MDGVVQKFKAEDIFTVEILLEYTEDDLIGLGLSRGLVRTMLRKAREIAAGITPPLAPPTEQQLPAPTPEPELLPLSPQPVKDDSLMLISMDVFEDEEDE